MDVIQIGSGGAEAAPARIETARLILRPPQSDDAARIADLINDFNVVRWLSRVPFPYALADAEAFVSASTEADPARERPLAIEHRDFGLIGMCGFHTEDAAPAPEIGYWLGRTFWGRGFASEATAAALVWARDIWGKRCILSGHFIDNAASGRVLAKAGFLYTGEVRPRDCVALGRRVATRMMVWLA